MPAFRCRPGWAGVQWPGLWHFPIMTFQADKCSSFDHRRKNVIIGQFFRVFWAFSCLSTRLTHLKLTLNIEISHVVRNCLYLSAFIMWNQNLVVTRQSIVISCFSREGTQFFYNLIIDQSTIILDFPVIRVIKFCENLSFVSLIILQQNCQKILKLCYRLRQIKLIAWRWVENCSFLAWIWCFIEKALWSIIKFSN